MAKLIQYATRASHFDGGFGGEHGWIAAGMGYLAVTDNGRLIAVDGGFPEDAEEFSSLLLKYSNKDTAEVDLWVVTHPHIDHYGVIKGITESKDLQSRVRVKRILCLFEERFAEIEDSPFVKKGISVIENALSVMAPELIIPKEGDAIDVDGAVLKILSVPEFTENYHTPNYLSLIFKLKLEDTEILFTGDSTRDRLEKAAERLGGELKSHILQMPHHGLCDTGNVEFYKAVDAKTLLVPICVAGERSMKSGIYGDAPSANEYAEKNASRIFRSYEGTAEIPLR